jgi:hypothetical protein
MRPFTEGWKAGDQKLNLGETSTQRNKKSTKQMEMCKENTLRCWPGHQERKDDRTELYVNLQDCMPGLMLSP